MFANIFFDQAEWEARTLLPTPFSNVFQAVKLNRVHRLLFPVETLVGQTLEPEEKLKRELWLESCDRRMKE